MTDNQNQNVDEFGVPFNEEMGQSNDSIGQDEMADTQTSEQSDWESQAKYFQSEKDKLYAENQKLKEYKEIGNFLESRPDIVDEIINKSESGGQPASQPIQTPSDFDPWEAYNDPASESYKFRMQEMQSTINNAVGTATKGLKEQAGKNELTTQLSSKGMTDAEINSFMEFASKHPTEYGLDNVIKMWQSVSQAPAQSHNNNPLDQVRNVQSQPQPTGVLAGERPRGPKSDNDSMWDGIMKAGSRKNVL